MKWVEVGHPNWGSNIGLAFLSAKEIFNSMINKEVNVWVNLNNQDRNHYLKIFPVNDF